MHPQRQVPMCEYYNIQSNERQEVVDTDAYGLVYAHEIQEHSEQLSTVYFCIPYSLATLDTLDVQTTGMCTPEELMFPSASSYMSRAE